MDDLTPIPDVVARMRVTPLRERTPMLQRLMGEVNVDARVMQWRALLVTALREADVWLGKSWPNGAS